MGVFVAGLALIGWANLAAAVDVSDADRGFRNFSRDAATLNSGQIRLEVQGLTLHDDNEYPRTRTENGQTIVQRPAKLSPVGFRTDYKSITANQVNLLASYGLAKNAEIGFLMPYMTSSTDTKYEEDAGDLQLYVKFRREVAERCALGFGAEVSVPTGNENKQLGTGETGLNPFVSTRYSYKALAVGGHVGYQVFSGDVPDVFNWSFDVIVRPAASYALRTEVTGRLFHQRGSHNNDITMWPGVDVNFAENFTIRPTGIVHLTDLAYDWGLGLGLAYIF
jgi:hypothetical protein